jgi:hypothetical protein
MSEIVTFGAQALDRLADVLLAIERHGFQQA